MTKIKTGILLGMIAGIIDVTPMLAMRLTLDACLSAFSLWAVVGILVALIQVKITGALKGIFVSFLVLLPCAILIGWHGLSSLIPIIIMTTILGSGVGILFDKISNSKISSKRL